ncbi:signal transducing adapter molecule 2 [Anopheles ziemanni]|uniref:signal transducing adapter molecule 2 n=1 Tax=Anopheles coustani TaxID=139045 RepID=UPI002659F27E|nr:signal transducing adapter molecule 2 [Anopheles coustani]XP_058177498.1 signal transducing adapter molecule 2 [Anopheles ziemanni]
MSLFGASSSLNQDIEKATSENSTTENWGLILDICDRVNNGSATPKDCLKSIVKKLNSPNPHVVMKAITLLDACVNNCGKQFHLEVASREFETEFKKLLQKSQPKVNTKLKLTLKQWSEKVFKSDPQLDLIPSLYKKLREEGHDFSDPSATPKRETTLSKDPNVVSSQQEEDDIAKAIELSLKEVKINQSPKMLSSSGTTSSSLYPSALLSAAPVPEPRKVRALYDFEAAEDNELTFQAGEIIMVLDDSDPNWWKGQNQRGEGLFPSNFVTADLSVEPETLNTVTTQGAKKTVQFSDEQQKSDSDKELLQASTTVEINEEKIDRLLHLIHEADPEDPSQDTEEMLQLEQLVNQMGPMIDAELERVDRKHAQLTQLSSDLVDAINLYHNLMREPDRTSSMRAVSMVAMAIGSGGLQGPYGLPPPPPGGHSSGPASMGPMYGMPGMFPTMPDGGMYPMGPGQQPVSMDGGSSMQRYTTGHNYYDPAAMNATPMADHSQSHQTMHHPHPHHHHHQQQQQQQPPPPPSSQQVPLPVVSQNGPITNGMVPPQANAAPVMSMGPGVTSQQVPPQTTNTTNPQGMPPNMTVPPMAYNNPTSPPPTGLSGPQAQAFRQMRPMGQPGQPGQQMPPVSFPNYVPQQPSHQQSQPAGAQMGQPPQGVQQHQQGPPQHHVPVSAGSAAQTTAPSAANMNHHQHHHHPQQQQQQQQHQFPMNMPPSHFPAPSVAAAPVHHLQQQQPPTVFMPQMGPTSNPMGNFSMGPMSMFPPGAGTTGTAGPLSINTNHPGPQNIPIYQQQR